MIVHEQVRQALIDRVLAIPSVAAGTLYDPPVETIGLMPFAAVWRDETASPDLDVPLGPFGHYDVRIDWVVRVYIQNIDAATAQRQADEITAEIFDRFPGASQPVVAGPDFQIVQTRVQSAGVDVRDTTPPLLVVEAALTTIIDAL